MVVVFGNLQQFLYSLVGRMMLIPSMETVELKNERLTIVSVELVVVMVITLIIQFQYLFI